MAIEARPRVVIVGAGFGGLWAARTLAGSQVETTIIDRDNYHTFLPLLYQVSSAELEPEEIAYPVRSILRKIPNAGFVLAEVGSVDFDSKIVETDGPAIPYDYLILAAGSTSYFFGVPGAEQFAFSLKTLDEGTHLRNHILSCFEEAVYEKDPRRQERLLTFTVVGGGATGVEFAGALAELINGPLVKDYTSLDFNKVRVLLLEASDDLLPSLPEQLRRYAATRLRNRGVDVRLGTVVSKVERKAVHLKDGSILPTQTVIWTAGVQGNPIARVLGLPTARDGRITVSQTLEVPDYPEVYAIGDIAYIEEDGRPLPLVAPVAVQQGTKAAQNILRRLSGQEQEPFKYYDKGTMVTIGRNAGVVRIGKRGFTGLLAWILWLAVHLVYLIGFRNRLLVMINWSLDYFLFERAVRFIFPPGSYLSSRSMQSPLEYEIQDDE